MHGTHPQRRTPAALQQKTIRGTTESLNKMQPPFKSERATPRRRGRGATPATKPLGSPAHGTTAVTPAPGEDGAKTAYPPPFV